MKLVLERSALALLSTCENDAVLGIIRTDGAVVFKVGDRLQYCGHQAWKKKDSVKNVFRGFSLVVRAGRVSCLLRASTLNPRDVVLLEQDLFEQLEELLPLADDYRRFGD